MFIVNKTAQSSLLFYVCYYRGNEVLWSCCHLKVPFSPCTQCHDIVLHNNFTVCFIVNCMSVYIWEKVYFILPISFTKICLGTP